MIPAASLDDLYYYAMVVKHSGFAAAGRALDVPKSRLSRHVNAPAGGDVLWVPGATR